MLNMTRTQLRHLSSLSLRARAVQDFKEKGAVGAVKDAVADAGEIQTGAKGQTRKSYEM